MTLNRSKMQTVKKFQGISNLSKTANLHGLLRHEEPSNWKNQFLCFQKHTLKTSQDLRTHCLYLKIFRNSRSVRPRRPPKHNSINGNCLFKFPLNNRQPPKLNWKKLTVNRQSYYLIETLAQVSLLAGYS